MFSIVWRDTFGKRYQTLLGNETAAKERFESVMRDRQTVHVALYGEGFTLLDEADFN